MNTKTPTAGQQCDLRVLVLSKRQYMSRDLLDDRYGRFRELPMAMSKLGVPIEGLCLSYRDRPEVRTVDRDGVGSVPWTSVNSRRLIPVGRASYLAELDRIGRDFRPTVIWACSDVPHAVLGTLAARRIGAKLVVDLYDNFESYPLSRVPGVNLALRLAIGAADGVTCVSSPLSEMIRRRYNYQGSIATIENAIPHGLFAPGDKLASRQSFGLPATGLLIGTVGALSPGRGTDQLIDAFLRLAQQQADAHLVLAGPLDASLEIPETANIHYLGLLGPDQVPKLLPALDISVVGNRDSAFGRYCFPQKLYESLACGVPVAVARVGAMAALLSDFPENLYEPDSVDSLLATLLRLTRQAITPDIRIPTWDLLGETLASFLQENAQRTRAD